MPKERAARMSFVSELKRRNVLRVAIGYLAAAWLLIQLVETLFPIFDLSEESIRLVVILLAIGFPLILIISWLYELTPDGLMRDKRARVSPQQDTRGFDRAIIAILAIGLAYFAVDEFVLEPARDADRMQAISDLTGIATAAHSIAVLPFADLSEAGDQEYFSDGISEELLNLLTKIPELRVVARTSAFSFKGSNVTVGEIGDALNVSHVLEGSVRKQGNQLRITAQLIEAGSDSHLFSETYDVTMDDIFAVQDDIAARIVASTRLIIFGDVPTTTPIDPAAYELLLRANQLMWQRSEASLAQAEELYREALAIEPENKNALLGLAWASSSRATYGFLPREPTYSDALALIRKTISLDENYADGYLALAETLYRHFWIMDEAKQNYEKALELGYGSANIHSAYARFLSKIGEFDAAMEQARIGRRLDPLSASANSSLVLRLIRAGELDESAALLEEMHARNPENGDLPWLNAMWHMKNGSYQDVLSWISMDDFEYIRLSISAIAYHHLGRTNQADEALQRLIDTDSEGAAFQIAEVYAQRSMPDEAFQWLNKAYAAGDPGIIEMLSAETLVPLYPDPRFNELLSRIGLPTLGN